ncbi:MAG: prepilin peptidase [Clostridium cadaveris]|uniref:Prepilin peptidase n=1 Tax=Clostridium cadaveris TaxID=1529 RepID=A0A316MBU0_9CLOT|nr:MAG: prepilin peptidase [Clostridium cadaveris]
MDIFVLKGILYVLILAYASFCDIKTKIIPDKVHIVIIIVALINLNSLNSIIGLLLVPIPFFTTALIKNGGIGGGDVKFMGANGFFLGVKGGLVGSFLGLIIAITVNKIYYKIKKKDNNISFPLAPYLSVGCFLTYLLF